MEKEGELLKLLNNNLNRNELNPSTKRPDLLNGYITKTCIYVVYKRPRSMDTYRLKERGWKNIFHVSGNQKKSGIAILTNR